MMGGSLVLLVFCLFTSLLSGVKIVSPEEAAWHVEQRLLRSLPADTADEAVVITESGKVVGVLNETGRAFLGSIPLSLLPFLLSHVLLVRNSFC